MKIALIGTHGVGKSTASYYLTSLLKQNNPTKSIICLEENVRKIAKLTDGKLDDPRFPKLAISDQLFRELHSELIYDIIVTDRSLIDFLAYSKVLELNLEYDYKDLCINHMKTFDKIYLMRPEHKNSGIANDGFRDTNKKLRNSVDDMFQVLLELNQIKHTEIKTSEIFTFDYLKDLE